MSDIRLLIANNGAADEPILADKIEWSTEIKGSPGKLVFTVAKDNIISFQEGNHVALRVDGADVFYGFVFTKTRDKQNNIKVTAYDQMRYLKNKDTYYYSNKSPEQLIAMIAADFKLNTGQLARTNYTIAKRKETNQTLIDMIQTALDLTLQDTGELYVLYDDFGKLTLHNVEDMRLNIIVDPDTAEDFDYTTSIDSNSYNKIKLSYDNSVAGTRDIYMTESTDSQNRWGVLQYFENIKNDKLARQKANQLLKLYNNKSRSLTLKNVIGDVRVRGGSSLGVRLDLGDIIANYRMIVERVTHTFADNEHLMNITVKGWGA